MLLHLFGEKWVLIDCNLSFGEAREKFFEFVSAQKIEKLDLVCLTHAHEDHYAGMEAVISHFTSGGRSVGVFCDSGIDPRIINTLLKRRFRPPPYVREYERLYKLLRKLFKEGMLLISVLTRIACPLSLARMGQTCSSYPLDLVPMSCGNRPLALSRPRTSEAI
jgi:hypothetical protein